jgi:hypothetical protein
VEGAATMCLRARPATNSKQLASIEQPYYSLIPYFSIAAMHTRALRRALLGVDDLDCAEAFERAVDEEDLHGYVGLHMRLA